MNRERRRNELTCRKEGRKNSEKEGDREEPVGESERSCEREERISFGVREKDEMSTDLSARIK